jgi:hypothetical protein
MKKILFLSLAMAILSQGGYCAESNTATILNDIKNAVVQDITDTVTTNVNSVKLAAYKAELEQRKKELEEVEKSSTFFIVKYFREASLKAKIAQLEANIKELEEAEKK